MQQQLPVATLIHSNEGRQLISGILSAMMLSAPRFSKLGRRCFSVLAENVNVNHPRMGIAKNYLKLRRIADATDEAALRAALTDTCTVEQVVSQPDLSAFELYLTSSTSKPYHAPFVDDANLWQNRSTLYICYREVQKLENYGFLIGFA